MDYFFLFSLLGHIIESFFYTSGDGGILYGPYTPVYGIGVCIVVFVTNIINKKNILYTLLIFFILNTFAMSLTIKRYINKYEKTNRIEMNKQINDYINQN